MSRKRASEEIVFIAVRKKKLPQEQLSRIIVLK
jgi:hypothetical protein